MFLRWLSLHPILRRSKYLCEFLKEDLANGFKKVGSDMEKESKVTGIEESWSPEGVQRCVINGAYDTHLTRLETLCSASLAICSKQRTYLKQIIISSDQLSSSLYQLGEGYKCLNQVAIKYNSNNQLFPSPKLEDLAMSLNHVSMQWGNQEVSILGKVQWDMLYYSHYNSQYI